MEGKDDTIFFLERREYGYILILWCLVLLDTILALVVELIHLLVRLWIYVSRQLALIMTVFPGGAIHVHDRVLKLRTQQKACRYPNGARRRIRVRWGAQGILVLRDSPKRARWPRTGRFLLVRAFLPRRRWRRPRRRRRQHGCADHCDHGGGVGRRNELPAVAAQGRRWVFLAAARHHDGLCAWGRLICPHVWQHRSRCIGIAERDQPLRIVKHWSNVTGASTAVSWRFMCGLFFGNGYVDDFADCSWLRKG